MFLPRLFVKARSQLTGNRVSLSAFKGKGDALDRDNYRGLKLTKLAMKILERIGDGLIRQVVSIDDSQFGFVSGRGISGLAAAGEIASSEQVVLYRFRGPREGISLCPSEGYLVGAEKARH